MSDITAAGRVILEGDYSSPSSSDIFLRAVALFERPTSAEFCRFVVENWCFALALLPDRMLRVAWVYAFNENLPIATEIGSWCGIK